MKHQPYEELLLREEPLSENEKAKLTQHLAICPQCARLEKSLQVLDHEFRTEPVIEAPLGFSARFKESLPARRKQKEREQRRIIIISMAFTVVAVLITLGVFLLPPLSPIQIFANTFSEVAKVVDSVTGFWTFVFRFFNAIPAKLSISLAVMIIGWIVFMLSAWGIALYRITLKGFRTTL